MRKKSKLNLKLGLLLLLMFCQLKTLAENVSSLIFIVSGDPVTISLAEKPVITYENNTLIITTTETTIQLAVADISSASFSDATDAGIKGIQQDKLIMTEDGVCFSQLKSGSVIGIYNQGGQLLKSKIVGADGIVKVDLKDYPKGIYLIKTERQTIKFINK